MRSQLQPFGSPMSGPPWWLRSEAGHRQADARHRQLQIVALFKAGRYTDKGWSLLEHVMAVIADLPAPSTVFTVGTLKLGHVYCSLCAYVSFVVTSRSGMDTFDCEFPVALLNNMFMAITNVLPFALCRGYTDDTLK
jgi:hypothetical protein